MRINWKLRIRNKATLSTLVGLLAAVIYQILGWFGVIPKVPLTEILDAVSVLLEILGLLGIIVDPTTKGISDSNRAMEYEEPSAGSLKDKPELPDDYFESGSEEEEEGSGDDGE